MVESTLIVKARLGLHARAAARLVRVASAFECKILLERIESGLSADAKSILSVLMLAAAQGTELRAIAEGRDEVAALKALEIFFEDGFGETTE